MKKCSKCKENKQLDEFSKSHKTRDGLQYNCKDCWAKYNASHYVKNKEKIAQQEKDYRTKNRERVLASKKEYRQRKKQAISEYQSDYQKQNRKGANLRQLKYMKLHPGKINSITAKRRALKLQAAPKWLTKEHRKEIRTFYIEAARLTRETNTLYEVDHIIPLQGGTVSGLHVPWNLQILTKRENCIKNNKL